MVTVQIFKKLANEIPPVFDPTNILGISLNRTQHLCMTVGIKDFKYTCTYNIDRIEVNFNAYKRLLP